MKILNRHTENTGGGCMITYVDVSDCDDVVQFGIDEEAIVAYRKRYGDTEDCMSDHCEWVAYTDKELRQYLSNEEADSLIEYLLEYCFRFKIHPSFELQPVRFEKYRLEFVGKVATKRKHIDLLAFISALDTIATIGNIHSRTLVASIQPCGPAINIDIDADVYQNVRETIYDILMADFF